MIGMTKSGFYSIPIDILTHTNKNIFLIFEGEFGLYFAVFTPDSTWDPCMVLGIELEKAICKANALAISPAP